LNHDLAVAAVVPGQSAAATPPAGDFATQGEQDFRAARYTDAIRNWQHALVDDPQNGGVALVLSQAFFAVGRYDEAAGVLQQAMSLLPPERWGAVVTNYAELYRSPQDYTTQLRSLEAARKDHDSPAVRFLLGFHYGYLGYPHEAVRELDRVVQMNPQDQFAKDLRKLFTDKPPVASPAAVLPGPAM
jgi:tetratricopeptide (TPR) repeat protein